MMPCQGVMYVIPKESIILLQNNNNNKNVFDCSGEISYLTTSDEVSTKSDQIFPILTDKEDMNHRCEIYAE